MVWAGMGVTFWEGSESENWRISDVGRDLLGYDFI